MKKNEKKNVKFAIQKGSQIGFIFERFCIKKVTLKSDSIPGSSSDGNVMLWDAILVSFGALFGEMSRISEKCVFDVPAIKNQRFPRSDGHRKDIKIGRILDRRSGSDFRHEIRQKGSQNGSQIKENLIKN